MQGSECNTIPFKYNDTHPPPQKNPYVCVCVCVSMCCYRERWKEVRKEGNKQASQVVDMKGNGKYLKTMCVM